MSSIKGSGRGIILFAVFCQFLIASSAFATNHIVRINEIMAGVNGDSSIQFVEMTSEGPFQKDWGPLFGEPVGRGTLIFFDANGTQTGRFVVPFNPGTASDNVLFATQAFVDSTGLSPDFIIPPLITPNAGKVCFRGNPDNFGAFVVNVCLSYGGAAYTGSTDGAGPTNPATLSTLGSQSLTRINFEPFGLFGDFDQNNTRDFALATPTPASSQATITIGASNLDVINNVVGEVALPVPDSLVNQGKNLFEKETFGGNGRTCATCHLEVEFFGMTPATVATLPADDPLFIHEHNINQIIVNSQGSVNPISSTGTAQPSDFMVGDTITGSLGGTATVLSAGPSSSYLVIGGDSLNIPDNVISDSNGNTGTLVVFTQGNLNGPNPVNGSLQGLEDSLFLRGPRALVLENINGFNQLEFMRGSPSLLNLKHTAPYGLSGEFPTLQQFSAGAVAQHFPRDLQRIPGVHFREPTNEELDALTAFQESLVSIADENFDETNNFDRFATTEAQKRGRDLFFGIAQCSLCHNGIVLAHTVGTTLNQEFDTGVALQQINITEGLPTEQDIGLPPNSRLFSVPTLFDVKRTAPYFHDNSVPTLLEAIQFYDGPAFRASPEFPLIGPLDAVSDLANAQDIEAFLKALVDVPFSITRKLNFRNVPAGGNKNLTATITNTGTSNLAIDTIVLNGVNAGEYSQGGAVPDAGPILPGETRTIEVTLSPVSAGDKLATLELTVNDGSETYDVGVALIGAEGPVLPEPEVDVSPLSIDFGDQDIGAGPTASQIIIINNIGSATGSLSISAVNLVGANVADFNITSDSGESVVVPGGSRSIEIAFDPTAVGESNALLQIETDDGDESLIIIPLSGVGVPPQLASISITPSNVSVPLGLSQSFTATGLFTDGSTQDVTSSVNWSSSNPIVASISSTGFANSINQGSTTISAELDTVVSNNAELTVIAAEVVSLFLTPSSTTFIPLGRTQQFFAQASMTDGGFIDVTNTVAWGSSNPLAATIDSSGLVTTVTQGQVTSISATASTSSGSVIRSVTVFVDAPVLESFVISPNTASIPLGQSQVFTAEGTFSDGSVQDVTNSVFWQSSSTFVATIGFNSGIMLSQNQGNTIISASSGGVFSSNIASVTVTAPELSGINVSPASISLFQGETQQFVAMGVFTNGSLQVVTNTVTWSSNNTTAVSISSTGLATANAVGSASITASQGVLTSNSASVTVSNAVLTDIQVSPSGPLTVTAGDSLDLTATGLFSNGSNSDMTTLVTWVSSNPSVATVNGAGTLTTLTEGVATITATSGAVNSSNSLSLTVDPPAVVSFSISPLNTSVNVAEAVQFNAMASLSNGGTLDITNQVTWISSDPAIASINPVTGLATGVDNGSVTVSASFNVLPADNTSSLQVSTRPLQVRINEVMAGLNGDSDIQFVELVTEAAIDKLWGPQGTETVGRLMLVFFDKNNNQTGRFVVATDPDSGASSANTVLFATQEFASLTGITPDYVIPKQVMPVSGKLCVRNNEDNSNAAALNLCFSYGGASFNGVTETADAANNNSLEILDSLSLRRSIFGTGGSFGNGNQLNSDFILGTPTPSSTQGVGAFSHNSLVLNIGGEVVMPVAVSLAEQGDVLFNQETFLGNGRTCASCHVPTESFGMPPSHVATLPNDDPLFIHEQNINQIIVNSQGSINPTAASGLPQPSDYSVGSTITGSLGGSAKVLARSGSSYLIIGGDSLNIIGNVISDSSGNTGTLVAFVSGDLVGPNPVNGSIHGLEISSFLRGPRALVLENINGFPEEEFMRSSPTLQNIKHSAPFGLSGEFPTLQEFSAGAVAQHFTKSLQRVADTDFRNATDRELDALTAFQETVLTVADEDFDELNNFDRFVSTEAQQRGRELFFGEAKCSVCHSGNVLAASDGQFGTAAGVNENFNTGVALQQINIDDGLPPEQNIGQLDNSREFNTPPLMGIRDTAPFFHESSATTLLEAVQFYDSAAFRASPAFIQVGAIDAVADAQNAADIVAFLESLTDAPVAVTSNLDFGAVTVGNNSDLFVTINNTSQENISIASIVVNGPDASDFFANSAGLVGTVILPGGSLPVNVNFAPTASGVKSATFEVTVIQNGEAYSVGSALSGDSELAQLVSISIEPVIAFIELGNTVNFTATGSFNNGSVADVTNSVVWSSSDNAVATITNAGIATAVGEGSASINATSGGISASTLSTINVVNGDVAVDPTSINFVGEHNITDLTLPTQSVTITNDGAGVLTISNIVLSGANPADFSIINDSGQPDLAPSLSRTFDVQFNPQSAGVKNVNVVINSDDADQAALNIAVSGVAINPLVSLSIDPATATVELGDTDNFTATGTFADASQADITGTVTWSSTNPAVITIDNTGTATAVGEGTASISAASGGISSSVPVTVVNGNVLATPNPIQISDHDINNPTLPFQSVTVTNNGAGQLSISSISVIGANAAEFTIASDSGETNLVPAASRTFDVVFNPASAGVKSASVRVVSDDSDQAQLDIPIQATGLNPQVSISPLPSLNFGARTVNTGASTPMPVVISNSGDSVLSITSVSITGVNNTEFSITSDTGEAVLSPGASRTVNVAFSPTVVGLRSANLEVLTSDFDNNSSVVTLTGESVAVVLPVPNIQATPDTINFPDQDDINNKVIVPVNVEVTNGGTADLEILNVELTGPNSGAFIIAADTGETPLAPGETRTIVLNFSPDEVGSLEGALTITSNDPDMPTLDVPLTGVAAEPTGGDTGGGGSSEAGAMSLELLVMLGFLFMGYMRARRREEQIKE